MVDILERLRSPQTSLGTLWPQPNLHEEAAEKIIQLRKELDETKRAADAFVENEHLREEITRLREENARLREALSYYAEEDYNGYNGSGACARAAIQEGGKDEN